MDCGVVKKHTRRPPRVRARPGASPKVLSVSPRRRGEPATAPGPLTIGGRARASIDNQLYHC